MEWMPKNHVLGVVLEPPTRTQDRGQRLGTGEHRPLLQPLPSPTMTPRPDPLHRLARTNVPDRLGQADFDAMPFRIQPEPACPVCAS